MGVGNASQRKFGCLPRALDAFSSTRPPKTVHYSSTFVRIVVALRHHVEGWRGGLARACKLLHSTGRGTRLVRRNDECARVGVWHDASCAFVPRTPRLATLISQVRGHVRLKVPDRFGFLCFGPLSTCR